MSKRWLFLPNDPDNIKVVAFSMVFTRSTVPIVFDAYLAAEHEGASGLGLISLINDFILSKMMAWGEFFAIDGSTDFEASR